METTVKDPKSIPGWGIDADPKNDPTYPMRSRLNVTQDPDSKHRPAHLQPVEVELLKSIERPNVSAVYGEASPPRGLSGWLRRLAFKYSESHYGHWLPLLMADRVDVVEGVLDDLVHGKLPNIYAEKGYPVEMKYNKTAFLTKMATIGALTAGVIVLMNSGGKKDRGARPRKNYRSAARY
jgi:hypothetical protein